MLSAATSDLAAAVLAAAEAVLPRLPGTGLAARPGTPEDLRGLAAEPGAACVAMRLAGSLAGELTLLVAAGVDEAMRAATPAADAVAVWQPAVAELAAVLDARLGGLAPGAARVTEARQLLEPPAGCVRELVAVAAGEQVVAVVVCEVEAQVPEARTPAPPAFQPLAAAPPVDPRRLQLLRDVAMELSVELGRTRMTVRELLSLAPGAIVELDRSAGSPVDLLVNGTLIARGEVVVVDEEYAVRIGEIVSPDAEARSAS